MITPEQYFAAYAGHPDIVPEVRANAQILLDRANHLRHLALADGILVEINPHTGCAISGVENGGFRPKDCPIGALNSTHKTGEGIDLYDPDGKLDKWCLANIPLLVEIGIWIEHPGWTDGWSHWQCVPPARNPAHKNIIAYIPSSAPPMTTIYGIMPYYA